MRAAIQRMLFTKINWTVYAHGQWVSIVAWKSNEKKCVWDLLVS